VFDRQRVLEALDPHAGVRKVDLIAAHADCFADPQAVAVDHQQQHIIADAVAPLLGGLEELLNLGLVQEVLAPLVGVSSAPRIVTLNVLPLCRLHGLTPNSCITWAQHSALLTEYSVGKEFQPLRCALAAQCHPA
jgi:hypothetical protein